MKKIYIQSEGLGSYSYYLLNYLLEYAFPNKKIIYLETNNRQIKPHLIIRSGFLQIEPQLHFNNVPYILWSGESYRMMQRSYPPILEITSFLEADCIYLPFMLFSDLTLLFNPPIIRNVPDLNCCFVSSAPTNFRELFWLKLSKTIDKSNAYGKCLNREPIEGNWTNLTDLYSKYKFVIAMENTNKKGYITEKIINAYKAGAIPIYWGSDGMVETFFNPESFINISNYSTFEECISVIKDICNNQEKWLEIKRKPIFKDNKINDIFRYMDKDNLPELYKKIIEKIKKII
jgi:hypothetical protein